MTMLPCRECGAQCRHDDQFCGWCGSRDPIARGAPAASPRPRRTTEGGISDRTKLIIVLLAFLLPFGVHRFYLGHTGLGVAQLLLAWFCGIGVFWAYADGIYLILSTPEDDQGRPVTRWT
jgi:hypothetical protein